jgi:photosystem II stability/assembly factor-like uncharacterized protein
MAQVRIYTPDLEAPSDGQIGVPPDVVLSWFAVTGGNTGVINYDIQLDETPDFSSPVNFETELVSGVQMSELIFGNTYFWRVRAKDGPDISDWSETRSFSVISRPEIEKPRDNSEQSPEPLLEWTEVTGIDFYDYQFDTVYFWENLSGATGDDLFDAAALSADQAWMVGEKGLILFWDGTEWTEQESNTSDDLFALYILDANNAWAAGEDGTLLYSDGTSWTEQASGTSEDINDLFFLDATNGWAVAGGGEISFFNGTEWSLQNSPTTKDLFVIDFMDMNNGWAAGKSGTIIYYNGTEWVEQESNTTRDIYAIAINETGLSFTGGKSGQMMQYDGSEWTEYEDSPTNKDIYAMTFIDPTNAWASGKDGIMMQYDGLVWSYATSATSLDLNGIFFGNGTGLVAGEAGAQLAYQDDGFTSPLAAIKSVDGSLTELQMRDMCFGTNFFWRMRVRHGQDISDWSPALSFTTKASPDLQDPDDGSDDEPLDVVMKWRRISENVSYEVEIDDDPNFSAPVILPTNEIEIDAGFLKFGVEYFWRARALHTKDVSDWSETWSFTTINTVELDSPSNEATEVNTVPVLAWDEVGGALSYLVQLDDASDFETPLVEEEVLEPATELIVPIILEQEKDYFWRVKGQISNDSTEWSETWKFTTLSPIGIDENNIEELASIYPNPATDQLYLEPSGGLLSAKISISDLLGKEHINIQVDFNGGESAAVDVSILPSGIYLMRITDGTNISLQKLIIK